MSTNEQLIAEARAYATFKVKAGALSDMPAMVGKLAAALEAAEKALAEARTKSQAQDKLIREYRSAVAELCGWSCHSVDEGSGEVYWRNEDRSVPTVDDLDQIETAPDEIYGALTAWRECRTALAAMKGPTP